MEWIVYHDIGSNSWDTQVRNIHTFSGCIDECLEWSAGPCLSFDWLDEDSTSKWYHICYLRNFDKHVKSMASWPQWLHAEHCIGKIFSLMDCGN